MALFCALASLQVLVLIAIAIASVRSGSHRGNGEVNCAEDVEGQLAKGAEAEINEQPDSSAATTVSGAPEPAEDNRVDNTISALDGPGESREEVSHGETEAEEEMKSASKFSYFSIGISIAGIISIFSGYLGDQSGHARTVYLKVCTFFMLATFVSGVSMLLLIFLCHSSHISIQFFRSLKFTTLGFLTLSMFAVSILFLKLFAILAFVPTFFIVLISFIMAWPPCSHHRVYGGMPFGRLSESV